MNGSNDWPTSPTFERSPRIDLAGKRGLVGRELRSILRQIGHSIDRLRQHRPPPLTASDFGPLRALIDEAGELADILSVARPERAPGLERVDLNRFLATREGLMRRHIDSTVLVTVRPSPASAVVSANPADLEAVLLHLVQQAAAEMFATGELVISTGWLDHVPYEMPFGEFRAERHARLTVADSGAGFESDVHARVFHSTVKGQEASVAAIVHRFGGCLILEHEAGEGSRVHICLPAD